MKPVVEQILVTAEQEEAMRANGGTLPGSTVWGPPKYVTVIPAGKEWVAQRIPLGTFAVPASPFGALWLTGYLKPAGAAKSRKSLPKRGRRCGIAQAGIEIYLRPRTLPTRQQRRYLSTNYGRSVTSGNVRTGQGFLWCVDSLPLEHGEGVIQNVWAPPAAMVRMWLVVADSVMANEPRPPVTGAIFDNPLLDFSTVKTRAA